MEKREAEGSPSPLPGRRKESPGRRTSNFAVTVEDRRLLSLQGLVDMCFGKKWATMQDESGFYDGALLRARKMKIGSVARLLYTISDVLPQTASAGMILYKTEIKQLTEVVYTNFSTMTREAFFSNARNALPLNKAIKKRAFDLRLYAEPIFSPSSQVLGVLVCQAHANGGYTAVDRQFLQTVSRTMAAFMSESKKLMGQGISDSMMMGLNVSRINPGMQLGSWTSTVSKSNMGDSFLNSFQDNISLSAGDLAGSSPRISMSDTARRESSLGNMGGPGLGTTNRVTANTRSSTLSLPGSSRVQSQQSPPAPPTPDPSASDGSMLERLNSILAAKESQYPEVHASMDTWNVNEELLVYILVGMFDVAGALKPLRIPNRMMHTIIDDIREHYLESQFHNFQHAFTVTLLSFLMLSSCPGLRNVLQEPIFRFSLLLASLCHDINHPGNNNEFEIKSQSRLSILYNDTSVLEYYHCTVTFEILISHGLDELLAEIDEELWLECRQVMTQAILATDMKKHKEMQKQLHEVIREPGKCAPSDWVTYILHTADLGNLTLDWDVALEWENLIFREFKSQAKKEEDLNLDVAPYMKNMSLASRGRVQAGFIDFILFPWWESMAQLLPELQDRVSILHLNRKKYSIYLRENERRSSVDAAPSIPPVHRRAKTQAQKAETRLQKIM